MNYPTVTFYKNDNVRLANYLCYLGKQIACRYYQDRRLLVLPHLVTKDARTIYFPALPYPAKFWDKLSKFAASDYVFNFDKDMVDLATKLLAQTKFEPAEKMDIESAWKEKETEFFRTLAELIPSFDLAKVKNIEVLISPFGTVGSLFFKQKPYGFDFDLTVREDFGPAQIAETILTCFFHLETTNTSVAAWTNREAIIDFLLSRTKLAAAFDHQFAPTVSNLPEIAENLVKTSQAYLQKLGFPTESVLRVANGKITVNSVPVTSNFTPAEKRILTGLIENKGELLTYDEIGNLFWGEDGSLEKFSLYSIAKITEKIRRKIKNFGVYQELVYTVRGKGYVLYD